uniref:Protein kinase domain-containing protein n=1 Tax=Bursaphelenchus xylophilus TaxID=6326 RepID=A0A1I7RX40_BURXY
MDLGKVATIIQALNACEVLFGDVKPNRFEVKSFKMTEGQIELFATKDNAASFETVPINYTGPAFKEIQLQMSIQGNKTIVGGQVVNGILNCAVIGDDKELIQVANCNNDYCAYLFEDAVYVIFNSPSMHSQVYKGPGQLDMEKKQPNISCAHRFGVDDVKRAFYFKKNGTCMHEFFDGFKNPWSPAECDSFVPITLEPDTPTQFYHLRHLMIVTGCQMPRLITENMIDNTFIQFTFIDPTVTTTISTSTTIDEAAEMRLLALVAGCVGGGTLLVLVATLIAVFLKCLGINICCCKKKKKVAPKKAPPVPVRRPPQPYDLYPEYSMDEKTKSIKAEPKVEKKVAKKPRKKKVKPEEKPKVVQGIDSKEVDCAQDSMGNVDENLKSMNPLDHMPIDDLENVKLVNDPEFDGKVPEVLENIRTYVYVKKLGQGGFGAVYKYRVGHIGDEFVAIKFVKASNVEELRYAKKEFMQARQIERLLGDQDTLIVTILGIGRNVSAMYMVMPFYYRTLTFLMYEDEPLQLQKKLIIAYHLLRPILQLQKVKYAHLDLKPDNYMQRSPYSNACILCDFGLARRFGCKRGGAEGSADYMSVASHTHQRVTLLDDMQSWLITLIAIFRQDLPWRLEGNPRINSKGEESETGLHTDQADYRDKLFLKNLYFESVGRSSVQDTVICDLAEMIWFKDRRDMISMKQVLAYMDKLPEKYNFKYTDYWFDERVKYKDVKLSQADDVTQKSSGESKPSK